MLLVDNFYSAQKKTGYSLPHLEQYYFTSPFHLPQIAYDISYLHPRGKDDVTSNPHSCKRQLFHPTCGETGDKPGKNRSKCLLLLNEGYFY